jgi:hypothetical protein
MKKRLLAICTLLLLALFLPYLAYAGANEAVLGDSRWIVDENGDLLPGATGTYKIGSSSYEVDILYADEINLNGSAITSDTSTGNLVIAGDLSVDGDLIDADGNLDINAEGGALALQSNGSDILTIGSLGACLIGNFSNTGNLYIGGYVTAAGIKTGTDQSDAGAATGEIYADEDDDYTLKLGT